MESIEEQVKEIIADVLEVPVTEVSEDTAIGDFESWDSLHHLAIIAQIEATFDFHFTPDVMMELEDVGDIIRATEDRIK